MNIFRLQHEDVCCCVVSSSSAFSRGNKTLTKKEKKVMTEYSEYIQEVVKTKKVRLFSFSMH